MSDKKAPRFKENETMLCYREDNLCEAKCLKAEFAEDGKLNYLVHYIDKEGFYDEWVSDSRCFELKTSSNKQRKQEDEEEDKSLSKRIKLDKESRNDFTYKDKTSESKKSGKYVDDGSITSDISVSHIINIKRTEPISIPNRLKTILGDDWTFVNHHKSLIKLPAKVTINDILSMFLNEKKEVVPEKEFQIIVKGINSLKESFNNCINKRFLYTFEKHQYNCITKKYKDSSLSEVYGVQHLLRYLSHVESELIDQQITEICKHQVRAYSQELLDYIDNHFSKIFPAHVLMYFSPDLQYHEKSII